MARRKGEVYEGVRGEIAASEASAEEGLGRGGYSKAAARKATSKMKKRAGQVAAARSQGIETEFAARNYDVANTVASAAASQETQRAALNQRLQEEEQRRFWLLDMEEKERKRRDRAGLFSAITGGIMGMASRIGAGKGFETQAEAIRGLEENVMPEAQKQIYINSLLQAASDERRNAFITGSNYGQQLGWNLGY